MIPDEAALSRRELTDRFFENAPADSIAGQLQREWSRKVIPGEAVETHWLVFRDEKGWGCLGCDWTGRLVDFYIQEPHRRQNDDINIPF